MLATDQIVEVLKKIKDPESELSVHDLGLVKHVDYDVGRRKLVVALNFAPRMPSGVCCQPLAWFIQKKIVDELQEAFSALEEVSEIEFTYE